MTHMIRSLTGSNFWIVALLAMLVGYLMTGEYAQFLATPFVFGISDAELVIRSSADGQLIADETSDEFDLGGPSDLLWWLTIPSDATIGSAETLAVIFKTSATAGGTKIEEGRFSTDELSDRSTLTLAAEGKYIKRIPLSRRYLEVTFDTTTGTDYGAVDLRAVNAGEMDFGHGVTRLAL